MTSLWIDAEEEVKKKLENDFKKIFDKQKKLAIGKRSNGDIIYHKFDLVSTDREVVVEVKSSKLGNDKTRKAGYSSTRKWRLLGDLFYLEKVKAKTRILALTDKELCDQFKQDMDGLIRNIEIKYIYVR